MALHKDQQGLYDRIAALREQVTPRGLHMTVSPKQD